MSAMKYAAVKGYDVVRLPKDSLIYIDPANTIYMKSGISLDLNGSELKIVPNAYANYQAIIFKEGNINAFAGFLPENYTTAQYARRGFFEMTVICAINVALISFSLLICKKDKKGNHPLAVRIICAFICLFSLIIVATVIGKVDVSGVTNMVAGVGVPPEINAFAQANGLIPCCCCCGCGC